MLGSLKLRGTWRKIRSKIGIRSEKVAIRTDRPWYVRLAGYGVAMGIAAAVAWAVVENSYRITGFNREEAKQQIATLTAERDKLQSALADAKSQLLDRENKLKIEKTSQEELTRTVAQLQEESASLKEDLGFLRNMMSAGSVPEGLSISDFKVEPDAQPNEFHYRVLLTQGGKRKQDFKGKMQLIARFVQGGQTQTLSLPPDAELKTPGNELEFRYYQKRDGRFRIPAGAQLKSVQIRILGIPGFDMRSQRVINF